jgi:hypothetical protein
VPEIHASRKITNKRKGNGTCKWRYKAMTVVMALDALLAVGAASAADKKPNILVIWGDDIGYPNISAYNLGLMGYHTPNIDRIAKEGALFTDAYAFTQALYDKAKKAGCSSA